MTLGKNKLWEQNAGLRHQGTEQKGLQEGPGPGPMSEGHPKGRFKNKALTAKHGNKMHGVLELNRLKQESHKLRANLRCIVRPCRDVTGGRRNPYYCIFNL